MKISIMFLFVFSISLSASVFSQRVTLNMKNTAIRQVFDQIEKESGFKFFYIDEQIDVNRKVTLACNNKKVEDVLNDLFEKSPVKYKIFENKVVVLSPNYVAATKQQLKINGIVTDEKTGEVLPGVTVVVEGTTLGTTADMDGKYTIAVPSANSVLIFSYMGYVTQKIHLTGQSVLDVKLASEVKALDEVVVVGYGTVKKRDLTGPISSVSGKKLADIPVSSVSEALTGKLAGVQVTTTEGSPDADVKIRIRGGGSITMSNAPLYIVDGFPVDKISDIPPSDIQSVDVLKDASSTAIYGARGANGVVIVTTKSSQGGKLTINYDAYYGVKKVAKKMDVFSPYEFAKWQYEQAVLQNKVSDQYEAYFGSFDDMDLYKSMKGNDWQDIMFGRTGTTQSHSVSISGGSDKTTFRATYSRLDDKAVMLGSNFSRDNVDFKLNTNPSKWLKFDMVVRYSDTKINGGGANDQTGIEKSTSDSRLKNAIIFTPIPLKNMAAPDDDPETLSSLYDPRTINNDNDRMQRQRNLNLGGNITINLTKWLTYRTELGMSYNNIIDDRFYGLTSYYVTNGDAPVKNQPGAQLVNENKSSFRNANILTSNFNVDDHNFTLMLGEETLSKKDNTLTNLMDAYPKGFDAQMAWSFTSQGNSVSTNNYYVPDDNLYSYFGRLNYDYKGRYLVTATMRADGSSKFASNNRWGYFPSAAAAWRVSEEKFMESTKSWLSNLKLRASYGEAGNNNIPPLSYLQTYSSSPTTYLPTSMASSFWSAGSTMSNPDLKWETTITTNLGLDLGLFNNRLNAGVEVYKNKVKDLLINFPISGGYSSQIRNIGKTSNRGIEATLDGIIIEKKDFRLNFSFNISFNRNKVDDLGGLQSFLANSAWTSDAQASMDYIVKLGRPVGLMYGYVTDGMYKTDDFNWNGTSWVLKEVNSNTPDNSSIDGNSWGPGALKLKDLNGDGKISDADRKVIGDANPKHIGGFALSAYYKGFDLTANFNWVYGNKIYNANKIEFTTVNKYYYRNMLNLMNSSNRWTNIDPSTGAQVTDATALNKLNANANIWNPCISKYVFHSWAVEDGSFLRLNTLTLGYTLPDKLMSKMYIKQLRFYVSVYNLFVWTNYSGFDPEVDTRRGTGAVSSSGSGSSSTSGSGLTPGVDYSAYPRSRTCNFGVNLTF